MIIVTISRRTVTKILIVDDEADITTTTILKKELEVHGFELDAFNDPEEALEAFQPGKYGFQITEEKMPKMTGFELYREARKVDQRQELRS